MSISDEIDDDAFLLAIEAAEATAFDPSKRRRISTTPSSSPAPVTPPVASGPEGAYLAALKGSHSSSWQQEQPLTYAHKRADSTKTLAGGTQGASGACFKCGDPGHWARDCPQSAPSTGIGGGGGVGGGGYADAGGEVQEKACPCGAGTCLVLTSNTPRNPGRKFYKCPMRADGYDLLDTIRMPRALDNGGCNFFEWCDIPPLGPGNARSNTAFKSELSSMNMPCPCGAGTCSILTAKGGINAGKQFYRCPGRQDGTICSFFKWREDQQLGAGALLQASPQYQTDVMSSSQNSSKRSSSACFKCGQENHWAKDCPNQPSDPYPDKGGRRLTSTTSADSCFKCGKAGHWSRECPTLNSGGGGTGASLVKSSSTLCSWNSHRY